MFQKGLIILSMIALTNSVVLGEPPKTDLQAPQEYTLEDKQMLGHTIISIQPYLTPEEKKILSDLIKEGLVRQVMDVGMKAKEQAGKK